MDEVDRLMRKALNDGVFPGAVLLTAIGSHVVTHAAYGIASIVTRQPVTLDTVFDLASLTKPLATTLAIMRLCQWGCIGPAQRISSVLPAFAGGDKCGITIAQLLSHTAGVADYRPFYRELVARPIAERRAFLRERLVQEPLLCPPGDRMVYSDLGFMILEWAVEEVAGRRLDRFVADEIYAPLGVVEPPFFIDLSLPAPARRYAATEWCPWRGFLVEAQVHDENAYALGGIAGHAGLFGTAQAVHRVLVELLRVYHGQESAGWMESRTVRTFFRQVSGTDKSLGFDMPAAVHPSCGRYFSSASIGHLGFTGTSFWVDLKQSVVVVLLTNRVHPTREKVALRGFRPLIHEVIMSALQKSGSLR